MYPLKGIRVTEQRPRWTGGAARAPDQESHREYGRQLRQGVGRHSGDRSRDGDPDRVRTAAREDLTQ